MLQAFAAIGANQPVQPDLQAQLPAHQWHISHYALHVFMHLTQGLETTAAHLQLSGSGSSTKTA